MMINLITIEAKYKGTFLITADPDFINAHCGGILFFPFLFIHLLINIGILFSPIMYHTMPPGRDMPGP